MQKQLNIGILYYGYFPWNRGIAQLYHLLEELGHKPVIFASKPEARFSGTGPDGHRVFHFIEKAGMIQNIRSFPLPFNPFWKSWLLKRARELHIDCLFVRETPLSLLALNVAKRLGIPVILDIRENLPATYEANRSKKIPLSCRYQKRIAQFYESLMLPKYDHIFTVSPELAEWINSHYKLDEQKITSLGNYPDAAFIEKTLSVVPAYEHPVNDPLRLVFAGYITKDRGLQDIIRSLPLVNKDHRCILKIIGEGDYLQSLRTLSEELGLNDYIEFLPLLPPDQLPHVLSECDIGICSYLLNEQTHKTLPGKLFEYMAVGLPVLTSARKSVMRIIDREQSGIVYHKRTPDEIASVINAMIDNPEKLKEMGRQGRIAIIERYNWKINLSKIERVLSNIL